MALRARIAASGTIAAGSARGPQGPAGPRGERGETGFSPVVDVTALPDGSRVSITDAKGTKSFEIKNGAGAGDMTASVYDPKGKTAQVASEQELLQHTENTACHVSQTEKAAWNAKGKTSYFTAVLPSSGWTESGDYITQTVTIAGMKSEYQAPPFVDVSLSGEDAESDRELGTAFSRIAALGRAVTGSGGFSFSFPATVGIPEANIPICITVFE